MQQSIQHNLFFKQSPHEVWAYLTTPELMEMWLMKTDFQPVVGAQFQFFAKPVPAIDFDGNIYCTVLEAAPFQKLTYSWKTGPGDGVITLDSVVEWTLVPKENGTELQLFHHGFKETDNIMMITALDGGWYKNMHKISEFLNNTTNATTDTGCVSGDS